MQKNNILYLIDHFHGVGGTENHLARLVTALDKEKFTCTIVAFDFVENHLANEIRRSGIELIYLSVGRYYTYNAFRQGVELFKFIKRKNIDIVQTFHFKSDFYGTVVARIAGVQCIISSRRDLGHLKTPFHFFLSKLVRRIPCKYIVVSSAVGRVVVGKEAVAANKITTIYNGVDLDKFQVPSLEGRQKARCQIGFNDTDFVVGTVGWFRAEKNYKVFFDAIKNASFKVNNLKAVAVGGDEDGLQLDYFKDYVKRAGLSDNVIFTGQIFDVRPYLRAFDVACLISEAEGFSNSIIEKMAMGLPLVVSDVGGNAEAVVDGYNGFVIPPNNADRLTETLIYLAEHPEERKEMGRRSVERVRKMFTLTGMIKAHEKLYESVLAN